MLGTLEIVIKLLLICNYEMDLKKYIKWSSHSQNTFNPELWEILVSALNPSSHLWLHTPIQKCHSKYTFLQITALLFKFTNICSFSISYNSDHRPHCKDCGIQFTTICELLKPIEKYFVIKLFFRQFSYYIMRKW